MAQETKDQRAERLRTARDTEAARHFTWSAPVLPDVPPPAQSTGVYTDGWAFRVYPGAFGPAASVYRAWSSGMAHGDGRAPVTREERWGRSASQHAISLYSTEALAWQAARAEVCRQAALALLAVDEAAAKVTP